MDLQEYLDDKVQKLRKQMHANSDQLTLGSLIEKVSKIKQRGYKCYDGSEPNVYYDFGYLFPNSIDSWRGIYKELALNYKTDGSPLPLSKFLSLLESSVGKTFYGYKGGEYTMDEDTPVWVANYGEAGNTAVLDVIDNDYQVIVVTGFRES